MRCSPHRRKQTCATEKALEHTVSAACFALRSDEASPLGAILVPSSPGRPRCAPSSLPAPRPAAPTASLTLPTPHTVPRSRLEPEGRAMGERSFQHKRMVLAGWRGSRLPLSPRSRAPRPVCQRSDEGAHLIAAGSPPSRWRRYRLRRWRVWGRKIDRRWRREPSRAPRPPRCQSPCRR